MHHLGDEPEGSQRGPHRFSCFTPADPARVWSALTEACQTGRYLYGLAAYSTWKADAPIRFEMADGSSLTGQVLHVQAPHRLSYVVQSGPHDPAVYLTWSIRACPAGSTIGLQVDETESQHDAEAEDVWLPVLAALQETLANRGRTSGTTREPIDAAYARDQLEPPGSASDP